MDFAIQNWLGPLPEMLEALSGLQAHPLTRFFSSFYFIAAVATIILCKKMDSFIRLRTTQQNSLSLLRLPFIALSLWLIYSKCCAELTVIHLRVFYLLYCMDSLLQLLDCILQGRLAMARFHLSEPTHLMEWATTLEYVSRSKLPGFYDCVGSLVAIYSLQMVLVNSFGLAGYAYTHRLIPSSIIGVIKMAHFVYTMAVLHHPYPTMFYLDRFAELFITLYVLAATVIYLIAKFISPQDSLRTPLFLEIDTSLMDDFNSVYRKLVEVLSVGTKHSSFSSELSSIFSPLGRGLPPRVMVDSFARPNPFKCSVQRTEKFTKTSRKGVDRHSMMYGPMSTIKVWLQILSAPLQFIASNVLQYCASLITRRRHDASDFEDEDDSDYDPLSCQDMDDLSDDETIGSDVDDDNVYQELFELARDTVTQSNLDPYSAYLNLFTQTDSSSPAKHTRRSKPLPIESAPLPESKTRLCVVCQTEQRSVVLWPCGCLCLCDERCRESMAARNSDSCPCCRTKVDGYQKIFQP